MSFKDCLYGQVRKLHGYPNLECTDLPNDLISLITKQEIITWDNTTGMNPLWNSLPTVVLLSYGEMLEKSWNMDLVWLKELTNGEKYTATQFEESIKENYNNEFTLISKRLSMWWFIDCFLNRPDVLNYDHVIIRQIDTLFNPFCNVEMIKDEMTRRHQKVFSSDNIPAGVPICYDLSLDMNRRHPSSTMITSHTFILNRKAVKILKDNFYQLVLNEIDYYYKMIGPNNFLNGDPGGIMHRICIKQNVEPISLREIFLRPEWCRGGEKGGTIDFSNLDRSGA